MFNFFSAETLSLWALSSQVQHRNWIHLQCDDSTNIHLQCVCVCACVCVCLENRESSLTCHRGGSLHQMSRRHKAGSCLCRWWSVRPRSPHTADQCSLTYRNTDRCSDHTLPDPKCPHHRCCSYKCPLGGWMRMLQWKGETRKGSLLVECTSSGRSLILTNTNHLTDWVISRHQAAQDCWWSWPSEKKTNQKYVLWLCSFYQNVGPMGFELAGILKSTLCWTVKVNNPSRPTFSVQMTPNVPHCIIQTNSVFDDECSSVL